MMLYRPNEFGRYTVKARLRGLIFSNLIQRILSICPRFRHRHQYLETCCRLPRVCEGHNPQPFISLEYLGLQGLPQQT